MGNGTLADRLEWARGVAGLTARALARRAGLTHYHVSLIEAGGNDNVKAGTLHALARTLGVSMDWLYAGRGPVPKKAAIVAAVGRASAVHASG